MSQKHSNVRELTAVVLAMQSLVGMLQRKKVQILSDNISTVAYINMQGGPSGELTELARKIWTLAISKGISIQAHYIAGKSNVQADYLSRLSSKYEWEIHPALFNYLDKIWGPHTLDRFGSQNTAKCRKYNSRFLDPGCCGVDALSQSDWKIENNFVNAPLRLLNKVIQVICQQEATATVIAPVWRAKTWYQKLNTLSILLRYASLQRGCFANEGVCRPQNHGKIRNGGGSPGGFVVKKAVIRILA